MAGFVQDSADWFINFPTSGNVKLKHVKSIEVEDEAELEAIPFVGHRGRPDGLIEKPGAIMITFTETPGIPQQVNWHRIKANKEQGSVTAQYRGGGSDGQRTQFGPAFVSKVTDAGVDNEGTSEREIVIIALGREDQ